MGLSRPRAAAVAGALAVALGAGAWWRARAQRQRWWSSVERVCACNGPALRKLEGLRAVAPGGLDRVVAAQARSLAAGCDDLRAAVHRRSAWQDLRGAPLDVTPLDAHARAQRDVARELGLACGEEHRVFWEGLRERVRADEAAAGNGAPAGVVRGAREILRVRDGMCERRASLSGPPGAYSLTLAEAEREGGRCGRE